MLKDFINFCKNIPAAAGIYLMKDITGRILYIGKAKSLPARVSSYFQKHAAHSEKTKSMLSRVADIEFIVTSTELEALFLENTLIKKHKPKYNILLRDDKTYPFFRVTTEDQFPRLLITRRIHRKNGSRYFGPYTPVNSLRELHKALNRHFSLVTCSPKTFKIKTRPCLQYQIKQCGGACAGLETKEDYHRKVDQLILFLEGRDKDLINSLKKEMQSQSHELHFEAAAKTRDRLSRIQNILERQEVVSTNFEDKDVVGLLLKDGMAYAEVLFIRGGKLTGKTGITLKLSKISSNTEEEILTSFLKQFYSKDMPVPPTILIPAKTGEKDLLEAWLSKKRGAGVSILTPSRGQNYHLIKMAGKNAAAGLLATQNKDSENLRQLEKLRKLIGMKEIPGRIEVFDISNISGDMATGSMIVVENNHFNKREYKRFKIKSIDHSNDYAMLQEVTGRHYSKADSFPDLIVIDGGKGQLNAVLKTLSKIDNANQKPVNIIGLAKEKDGRFERIYRPGEKKARILPKGDEATLLLMRIRDEAHRFAIAYHRKLRLKQNRQSALDAIKGLGPVRKRNLITRFGSVRQIKKATIEEITAIPGLTPKLAEHLLEELSGGKE